jgi:hypothetical protein
MPCSRQIHRRTSGLSQAGHLCCMRLRACVRTSHGPRDLRGGELSEQEHLCEALKLLRTWLSRCRSSSLQFLIGIERKASHRAYGQSLPGWPSRHRCPDGKNAKLGAGQACMHNVRMCAQQDRALCEMPFQAATDVHHSRMRWLTAFGAPGPIGPQGAWCAQLFVAHAWVPFSSLGAASAYV